MGAINPLIEWRIAGMGVTWDGTYIYLITYKRIIKQAYILAYLVLKPGAKRHRAVALCTNRL